MKMPKGYFYLTGYRFFISVFAIIGLIFLNYVFKGNIYLYAQIFILAILLNIIPPSIWLYYDAINKVKMTPQEARQFVFTFIFGGRRTKGSKYYFLRDYFFHREKIISSRNGKNNL
jgi:hypothetical protein